MKRKLGWKFLTRVRGRICSAYDQSPWVIGKWRWVRPPNVMCVGLNCSRNIIEAWSYMDGIPLLARVEYGGCVVDGGNKLTCQRMRLLRCYRWQPRNDDAAAELYRAYWRPDSDVQRRTMRIFRTLKRVYR